MLSSIGNGDTFSRLMKTVFEMMLYEGHGSSVP